VGGHPIVWVGPVSNWITACDLIESWAPETVVPGHGPVTDLRGVRAVRDYLEWITAEARPRFEAGMDPVTAAKDIPLGDYADWGDAERIVINVDTLHREWSGSTQVTPVTELFARMAELTR
jgi:glyoxylase-like metal-dependent hydrolase (beta-lactamase superfamily II)